jgi:hypothetical protein
MAEECPVCYEPFSADLLCDEERCPKLLKCGHAMCSLCLEGLTKMKGKAHVVVDCPICRKQTVVRNEEDCTFPNDFLLMAQIIARSKDQRLGENEILKNLLCENNCKNSVSAVVYCEDCAASFCQTCFSAIHENPAFKEHRKMSIQRRCADLNGDEISRCADHPLEVIASFCSEDSIPVCRKCIAAKGDHRGHRLVSLEKAVVQQKKWLNSQCDSIRDHSRLLQTRTDTMNSEVFKLEQNLNETRALVESNFQELVNLLQRRKEDALSAISVFESTRLPSMVDLQCQLTRESTRQTQTIGLVDTVVSDSKVNELLKVCSVMTNLLTVLESHTIRAQEERCDNSQFQLKLSELFIPLVSDFVKLSESLKNESKEEVVKDDIQIDNIPKWTLGCHSRNRGIELSCSRKFHLLLFRDPSAAVHVIAHNVLPVLVEFLGRLNFDLVYEALSVIELLTLKEEYVDLLVACAAIPALSNLLHHSRNDIHLKTLVTLKNMVICGKARHAILKCGVISSLKIAFTNPAIQENIKIHVFHLLSTLCINSSELDFSLISPGVKLLSQAIGENTIFAINQVALQALEKLSELTAVVHLLLLDGLEKRLPFFFQARDSEFRFLSLHILTNLAMREKDTVFEALPVSQLSFDSARFVLLYCQLIYVLTTGDSDLKLRICESTHFSRIFSWASHHEKRVSDVCLKAILNVFGDLNTMPRRAVYHECFQCLWVVIPAIDDEEMLTGALSVMLRIIHIDSGLKISNDRLQYPANSLEIVKTLMEENSDQRISQLLSSLNTYCTSQLLSSLNTYCARVPSENGFSASSSSCAPLNPGQVVNECFITPSGEFHQTRGTKRPASSISSTEQMVRDTRTADSSQFMYGGGSEEVSEPKSKSSRLK